MINPFYTISISKDNEAARRRLPRIRGAGSGVYENNLGLFKNVQM